MDNLIVRTEKNLLDKELIYNFISTTYWAKDRTFEKIERCVENSFNFGLYKNNVQIGYARVVTDFSVFAYLMDVFIVENEQKKGYSKFLLSEIFNHPQLKDIETWRLASSDARELYAKFGFTALASPEKLMEKIRNS